MRETNNQIEWAEEYELIDIRDEEREISIIGGRLLGGERLGIGLPIDIWRLWPKEDWVTGESDWPAGGSSGSESNRGIRVFILRGFKGMHGLVLEEFNLVSITSEGEEWK